LQQAFDINRRYPIGAEILTSGGVHFRVWAPRRQKVEVAVESGAPVEIPRVELQRESSGYFSGVATQAGAGTRYRFRLDGGDSFPDPASRYQPEGPHGPSQVVDPSAFHWSDADWPGAAIEGQIIYEMHIGTFTREGTWAAAGRELPELSKAGVGVLEVMPVADFPGRFGWGYDGVGWFAPVRIYGEPDDFRRFVDEAHRVGLGVILDVVYNHVGPDGNYLSQFSPDYFTSRYGNAWGEAINYDGGNAAPVREFVLTNGAYWMEEYHVDGLRLDATDQIFDASPENIIAALMKRVRAAADGRKTIVVAENEAQETRLVRAVEQGGYGLDALWNDDFHHTVRVAATGRREAYYTGYEGKPQELISAVKYGYLYQGQHNKWQHKRRGTVCWGLRPAQFVTFLDNHDQIANSGRGQRLHQLTSPGRYKALTALLLLGPGTPMLFQGQEFAAASPFCFFADFDTGLSRLVREGRADFLAQFPSLAQPGMRGVLPDPGNPDTFERCKLDFGQRQSHAAIYQLHKDLMRLRREDPVFRAQTPRGVDGAVLSAEAFLLRFFGENGDDRLLLVNLGVDLRLDPAPEPLLAPPEGKLWDLLWSSEDPRYGGTGTPPVDSDCNWSVPGHSAVAMRPVEAKSVWPI
jgi:maltooligosyltrehalose trehalohydrolase